MKPCSKCGVNPRRKSHVWCNSCAAEWQRAKLKRDPEYRKRQAAIKKKQMANPENRARLQAYLKSWHEQHPDYRAQWRANNPDYMKAWRAAHPNYTTNLYRRKVGLPTK